MTHGPVLRDHATDLPKKVRALGLKCALSSKAAEGKLVVLDEAQAGRAQDQGAGWARLGKLGWG